MDSILLQKQVRDNSEELRSYLKDLSSWEDEMKRKESSSTKKDVKKTSKKPKKQDDSNKKEVEKKGKPIRSYDYKAWDNFDVDAECERIDKSTDGNKSESPEDSSDSDFDPSEEYQQRLRDEASYEKERGNQFVKQQKWSEAIACYTHAIACYPKDPIFYANRALCHLKKDDLHSAEADCTSSLQLDPHYVKALQRRAAARIGLKQYPEALDDLKTILKLEPHNKESKKELERVEKILENKLKSTDNVLKYVPPQEKVIKPKIVPIPNPTEKKESKDVETPSKVEIKIPWPLRPNSKAIKTVQRLPHQRSKTPLYKIKVTEVTDVTSSNSQNVESRVPSSSRNDLSESRTADVSVDLSEAKVVNKVEEKVNIAELSVPKSSVQFLKCWKVMKGNKVDKFEYLKRIKPEEIPKIFQEAMESDVFEDILDVLQDKFVAEGLDVFAYLKELSNVKRFATLVMFMSTKDKNALKKLFDYCITVKKVPQEEIDTLSKKYEV